MRDQGRGACTNPCDGLRSWPRRYSGKCDLSWLYRYTDAAKLFNGEGAGAGGANIETLQQAVRDIHPMRTYGMPDDIANLVNWLASDEARYASGQLWVLDGGLSAQVQQMRL